MTLREAARTLGIGPSSIQARIRRGWSYTDATTTPAGVHAGPRPTPRLLEVVRAISRLTKRTGYAPTIRELAAELGIASTNGVGDHLDRARRLGLVTWEPGLDRTLRVLARKPAHTRRKR